MRQHKNNPPVDELDFAERPNFLALAAGMLAQIVAKRPTAAHEIPPLVASVAATVEQLLEQRNASSVPLLPEEQPKSQPPRARQPRARQKEARPARQALLPAIETPAPPPVAPRLVRRAEAAAPAEAEIMPFKLQSAATRIRGIVRWFDPGRQTGALRLPGSSEDVPIEPGVFLQSGIARLFKGQEIDADLDRAETQVRIVAIALPGAAAPAPSATGMVAGGRRPRMIIVEKKRDGLKRAAVRSTAERILNRPAKPEEESR